MTKQPSFENTDPWQKFKANHGKRLQDSWADRAFVLLIFSVFGGTVGGILGLFTNPKMPGEGHLDNLLHDSWEHILVRMGLGAAIGAFAAVIYIVYCMREQCEKKKDNLKAFR